MSQGCPSCGSLPQPGAVTCWRCSLPLPAASSGHMAPGSQQTTGGVGPFEPHAWAQNPSLNSPGSKAPQSLTQYLAADQNLVFVNPHTAGVNVDYTRDAFGRIGTDVGTDATAFFSNRVVLRALWQGPIFDLRPGLSSSTGAQNVGLPINRGGSMGAGMTLFLMLRRGVAVSQRERFYNYQRVDFVSFSEVANLAQVGSAQSITAMVNNAPVPIAPALPTSLLRWTPPAGPIRFWRPMLVVDIMANADGQDSPAAQHILRSWAA